MSTSSQVKAGIHLAVQSAATPRPAPGRRPGHPEGWPGGGATGQEGAPKDCIKVVGLDLSLTSTGVAVVTGGRAAVDRITSKPTGTDLVHRWARLRDLHREITNWTIDSTLVVVEGLAFSRTTGHATERAGLWWLVVNRLLSCGYRVAIVPPTSRAKYGTGKGNAGKDHVLAAVVRRYPDVEVSGNDEADALLLASMGARWLGSPIDDLPKTHLAALDGAAWPEEDA